MEIVRTQCFHQFGVLQRLIASQRSARFLSVLSAQPSVYPFAIPVTPSQKSRVTSSQYGLHGLGGIRTKIQKVNQKVVRKIIKDPTGKEYYGFTYFPRDSDEVDPPYEPSKLFMVKKIRSLLRKPWWDKKIMFLFKLEKMGDIVIVKNTPNNCKLLYQIKHMIEIKPITFANGEPSDGDSGFLKESGEYIRYPKIGDLTLTDEELEKQQALLDSYRNKMLNATTIRDRLHKKWYNRWDTLI